MRTNQLLIRTSAVLLHAIANFVIVNWLLHFDITSSWILFIGFVVILLLLLFLFLKHAIAYYYFLKTKT